MAADPPYKTLLNMTRRLTERGLAALPALTSVTEASRKNASSIGSSDEEVARLIASCSAEERITLAANRATPTPVLMRLAQDESSAVRCAVAAQPACPSDLLTQLVHDEDSQVRAAASAHPQLNVALLSMLAQRSQESLEVHLAVARHLTTSPDSLAQLVKSGSSAVRAAVARHPAASPSTLTTLASDLSEEVKQALASRRPGAHHRPVVLELRIDPPSTRGVDELRIEEPHQKSDIQPEVPEAEVNFLRFLAAEYGQEIRDLARALETLNRETLEVTRARWQVRLAQPQSLDQERLKAAHQAQVQLLHRESKLTLERELRVLRDQLKAASKAEAQRTALDLSRTLERERQNLQAEQRAARQARVQEEHTQLEQQHNDLIGRLRADQEMNRKRVLAEERQRLTVALEQELHDQQVKLQAESALNLQKRRAGLELRLRTELEQLREDLEGHYLQRLTALKEQGDAAIAAKQREFVVALDNLLQDQQLKLQTEWEQRLATDEAEFRLTQEAARALQEREGMAAQELKLRQEGERLLTSLEQEAEIHRMTWQQQGQADLARYQDELQAWSERTLGEVRQKLIQEHEKKLEQEHAERQSQFEQVAKAAKEEQLVATEAARVQFGLEAEARLTEALQEQRQVAEMQRASEMASLQQKAEEALVLAQQEWTEGWQHREQELLELNRTRFEQETQALREQRKQRVQQYQLQQNALASTQMSTQIQPSAEQLVLDRRGALENLEAELQTQEKTALTPGASAVLSTGPLVYGYPVPLEALPEQHDPAAVLAALNLIAAHLDVQGEALLRFTPPGQSRRSFLRQIDRAVEHFQHGHEPVILRADREDGPHYFLNDRLPRLLP
ncbi:hypothetical protein EHF33_19890 (plasmid) [Deinococcus psychrotolerans]|uniref:Uncharacterized protein n=1 Tax=Deinococcus psychrotolerans TaxID=2489213 RepID=A0A3G8YVF3_9DEIO|nr:hypothetical protein [Deinococcus psychrotolerans]AZI45176.1 hypothetical protein EHF33_19890 [Deinococcus psychrotolerans]